MQSKFTLPFIIFNIDIILRVALSSCHSLYPVLLDYKSEMHQNENQRRNWAKKFIINNQWRWFFLIWILCTCSTFLGDGKRKKSMSLILKPNKLWRKFVSSGKLSLYCGWKIVFCEIHAITGFYFGIPYFDHAKKFHYFVLIPFYWKCNLQQSGTYCMSKVFFLR